MGARRISKPHEGHDLREACQLVETDFEYITEMGWSQDLQGTQAKTGVLVVTAQT